MGLGFGAVKCFRVGVYMGFVGFGFTVEALSLCQVATYMSGSMTQTMYKAKPSRPFIFFLICGFVHVCMVACVQVCMPACMYAPACYNTHTCLMQDGGKSDRSYSLPVFLSRCILHSMGCFLCHLQLLIYQYIYVCVICMCMHTCRACYMLQQGAKHSNRRGAIEPYTSPSKQTCLMQETD